MLDLIVPEAEALTDPAELASVPLSGDVRGRWCPPAPGQGPSPAPALGPRGACAPSPPHTLQASPLQEGGGDPARGRRGGAPRGARTLSKEVSPSLTTFVCSVKGAMEREGEPHGQRAVSGGEIRKRGAGQAAGPTGRDAPTETQRDSEAGKERGAGRGARERPGEKVSSGGPGRDQVGEGGTPARWTPRKVDPLPHPMSPHSARHRRARTRHSARAAPGPRPPQRRSCRPPLPRPPPPEGPPGPSRPLTLVPAPLPPLLPPRRAGALGRGRGTSRPRPPRLPSSPPPRLPASGLVLGARRSHCQGTLGLRGDPRQAASGAADAQPPTRAGLGLDPPELGAGAGEPPSPNPPPRCTAQAVGGARRGRGVPLTPVAQIGSLTSNPLRGVPLTSSGRLLPKPRPALGAGSREGTSAVSPSACCGLRRGRQQTHASSI